jgi:hypothetical protein
MSELEIIMSIEKPIIYFEKAGKENTEETLNAAKQRINELGIQDVVIATSHGETALRAKAIFDDSEMNLIAVTICEGFKDKGWAITKTEKAKLTEKGIKVLTSIHAFGADVGSAFLDKYGGTYLGRVVRDVFYRFGQGMKVCAEIILMAADAGLIPMEHEVMAIAGTDSGADTCIIVKPAYPRKFFDLEIREIVAKPRSFS